MPLSRSWVATRSSTPRAFRVSTDSSGPTRLSSLQSTKAGRRSCDTSRQKAGDCGSHRRQSCLRPRLRPVSRVPDRAPALRRTTLFTVERRLSHLARKETRRSSRRSSIDGSILRPLAALAADTLESRTIACNCLLDRVGISRYISGLYCCQENRFDHFSSL